jgi:hypothetical protein
MKSNHKDIYGNMPWKYPNLKYRAVDKNGSVFYYEKRPVIRFDHWDRIEDDFEFVEDIEGIIQDVIGRTLWELSLQTYDQYCLEKEGYESEYERERRLWVEQTMSRLVEIVPPVAADAYCLYYDQMRDAIKQYAIEQRNLNQEI